MGSLPSDAQSEVVTKSQRVGVDILNGWDSALRRPLLPDDPFIGLSITDGATRHPYQKERYS
jgi:hypothetical protein